MALSGEADLFFRKHTNGLLNPATGTFNMSYIHELISAGVGKAISRFGNFGAQIDRLKTTEISDVEAKANIYDAVVKGVIPQAFLPKVGKAYFEPPHKEFEPRNMWSLQNAYTEILRSEYAATKPHLLLESTQALGTFFGL